MLNNLKHNWILYGERFACSTQNICEIFIALPSYTFEPERLWKRTEQRSLRSRQHTSMYVCHRWAHGEKTFECVVQCNIVVWNLQRLRVRTARWSEIRWKWLLSPIKLVKLVLFFHRDVLSPISMHLNKYFFEDKKKKEENKKLKLIKYLYPGLEQRQRWSRRRLG